MEYIYTKDEKEASLFACDLSCHNELGYDIETAGFLPLDKKSFILLDQFATPDACYVFDSRYIRPEVYKPILEDPSIVKIGHNLKFEYQHNKIKKGIELEGVFDTMLAYRVLTSGLKDDGKGGWVPIGAEGNKRFFPYKSLAFLALNYCGINLDKSVRDTFEDFLNSPNKDFTKEQLDYAAKDAQIVLQLKSILVDLLDKEQLLPTADLEFRFLPACSDMELNGVQLNTTQWREIIKTAKKIQAKARQLADSHLVDVSEQTTLFGDSAINIDSPIQVIRAFKRLGIDIENTDVKTLKNVKHPLAAALLDYRAYEKLLTTYGESLLKNINKETKRLHFTLHQLGADTGRLSSEKPNIQNIPKDVDGEGDGVKLSFRDCFVAPPGKKLLTADFSQCISRDAWAAIPYGLAQLGDFQKNLYPVPSINSHQEYYIPDGFVEKGYKNTVRVETIDGYELVCTPDHLLLVNNDVENSWLRADASLGKPVVLSRDWILSKKHSEKDLLLSEMLGFWTGDGSYTGGGVGFAKCEEKYYADVYNRLNFISQSVFDKGLKDYSSTGAWDLSGIFIKNIFASWGCGKKKAIEKTVPYRILISGRECIAAYLRGLFEADGWVSLASKNNLIAFSTRSEELSKQIQLLLLGLGIFSRREGYEETTEIKGRSYTGIQYRVSIRDPLNQSLFTSQIGFISKEKNLALSHLDKGRVRSLSDLIYLSCDQWAKLRKMLRSFPDWPTLRRRFIANYYNPVSGVSRSGISRLRLNLIGNLDSDAIQDFIKNLDFENKAFSTVEKVTQASTRDVVDVSVPVQRSFVAGGLFVHNCELRILAEESQDPRFLEIFRNDQDLHIITAQQVFDISDNIIDIFRKIKKVDRPGVNLLSHFLESEIRDYQFMSAKRDQTKTINFGIVYGLSSYSLMERYGMTEDEATDLLDRYFGTYKGIKLFLDKNSKETLKNRWAKTILGRKRFFHMPDPDSEDFNKARGAVRRMGNNHVIQGCNADITKEALAIIRAIYKRYGPEVKLLFTVHDEIVSEVPEDLVEEIKPLKAEAMRQAFHKFIKTVSVGEKDQVTVAAADWWSK